MSKAIGLNIKFLRDNRVQINACSIAIERNKLTFDKKLTELQDINELTKYLPANTPVALNLSGKGILTKVIEGTDHINYGNFNKLMPNAKYEDFYIQHFVSGDKSFVSVIRKTEADKWINTLSVLGYIPLMLSLAPFSVNHVIPQLNFYDNNIIFDGYEILINKKQEWLSFKETNDKILDYPLKIESEKIDQSLIIPYSVAFQLLLADRLLPVYAVIPELEARRIKMINVGKFRTYTLVMLLVFILILAVNFLTLISLNTKNTFLYSQMSQRMENSNSLQKLADSVKYKEAFLLNIGYDGNVNKVALLDKIASNLTEGVYWQSVSQNPVDFEESRIQKKLAFFNRKIVITGSSDHILPLNEWIARVKTQSWVKSIQLDNYTYNNELKAGNFAVTIDY